jgi:hypothetical protein
MAKEATPDLDMNTERTVTVVKGRKPTSFMRP